MILTKVNEMIKSTFCHLQCVFVAMITILKEILVH